MNTMTDAHCRALSRQSQLHCTRARHARLRAHVRAGTEWGQCQLSRQCATVRSSGLGFLPEKRIGTTRAPRQPTPRRTAPAIDRVCFAVRSGFATTVSGRPRWLVSRPAQGGATEATFGAGRHTGERTGPCVHRHNTTQAR